MEKKIEDYLHLYMGCACKIKHRIAFITDKITPSTIIGITERNWKVNPILRPLSDMTEEENIEYSKVSSKNIADPVESFDFIRVEGRK